MNNWYYYVLQLSDEHYYVGITTDIAKRIYEHTYKTKKSAAYTKQFEVVDVVEISYIGLTNSRYAKTIEREQTIKYMQEKGWRCVRGSDYSCTSEHLTLEQLIYDIHNKSIDTTRELLRVTQDDLNKVMYITKDRAIIEHKHNTYIINLKDVKRYCKMNKIKKLDHIEIFKDIDLKHFLDLT